MQIPRNTLHRRTHLEVRSSPLSVVSGQWSVELASLAQRTTDNGQLAAKAEQSDLTRSERHKLSLICGLSLVLALLSVARAAHSAAAPTATTTERQFIKSEFINTPGFGKDPFFPKSTRRGAPTPTNTIAVVAPAPITVLSLKGISRANNHSLAIINNRTFASGEEADMKFNGQTYRVKCVEIRDDGVQVIVNGQSQKLSLPPKF